MPAALVDRWEVLDKELVERQELAPAARRGPSVPPVVRAAGPRQGRRCDFALTCRCSLVSIRRPRGRSRSRRSHSRRASPGATKVELSVAPEIVVDCDRSCLGSIDRRGSERVRRRGLDRSIRPQRAARATPGFFIQGACCSTRFRCRRWWSARLSGQIDSRGRQYGHIECVSLDRFARARLAVFPSRRGALARSASRRAGRRRPGRRPIAVELPAAVSRRCGIEAGPGRAAVSTRTDRERRTPGKPRVSWMEESSFNLSGKCDCRGTWRSWACRRAGPMKTNGTGTGYAWKRGAWKNVAELERLARRRRCFAGRDR